MKIENGILTSGGTSINTEEAKKLSFDEFKQSVQGHLEDDINDVWNVINPKQDERVKQPGKKSSGTNGDGPDTRA